jgi:hypothetical protein
MPKLLTASFFIFLFIGLISCSSSKNIKGTYRNKFAVGGFFGTTIKLMRNDSLEFIFQGDLFYDKIIGHYQVSSDTLFITFDKEVSDTNTRSAVFNTPLKTFVKNTDTIKYNSAYLIGHNKLFPINSSTGKKISKAKKYNKRKKYVLFGSHFYNKRYCLKRID